MDSNQENNQPQHNDSIHQESAEAPSSDCIFATAEDNDLESTSSSSTRPSELFFAQTENDNNEQQPTSTSRFSPSNLSLSASTPPIHPVPLNEVEKETEPLFVAFVEERLIVDEENKRISNRLGCPSSSNDCRSSSQTQLSREERLIAHRLVELGDIMERDCDSLFRQMVQYLDPRPSNVSAYFQTVAKMLLNGSERNWAQIVSLFYLGYYMGIECLRQGVSDFLDHLSSTFFQVLRNLGVLKWVAMNGGWGFILFLVRNSVGEFRRLTVSILSITSCLILAWYFGRK